MTRIPDCFQLGETALHNACWHGFTSIVHTLCSHGAHLHVQNKVILFEEFYSQVHTWKKVREHHNT